MKRFRIGNDLTVKWSIKKKGESLDLTAMTVYLYMTHPRGRQEVKDVEINGSEVSFVFKGLEQSVLGCYTLTIDVRYPDGDRCLIQDKCGAFELVGRSCVEEPEDADYEINL